MVASTWEPFMQVKKGTLRTTRNEGIQDFNMTIASYAPARLRSVKTSAYGAWSSQGESSFSTTLF